MTFSTAHEKAQNQFLERVYNCDSEETGLHEKTQAGVPFHLKHAFTFGHLAQQCLLLHYVHLLVTNCVWTGRVQWVYLSFFTGNSCLPETKLIKAVRATQNSNIAGCNLHYM